ncbi:DUF4010 domain-containing protein [uncultured Cocleimonas sp.]|uniref:DUF4010 domain-containing protein n=1 Tax=uncultured Cocleimonas sp. TaxID=1051587 RepID=UPI0026204C5E|nr:DUF4010 domain-containing protein [uncultured Cocleimonas sp.]
MEHKTPLSYHFKDKHIWLDMALLALLYVVAAYFPILKIVPLVASLELFSFFSFHLLAKRSRFQVQGFLGGFISSTAVFVQMLFENKFASISERDMLLTLFFALCAMLLECLFIIFFLSENLAFIYYLPFITQLIIILAAITYLNVSSSSRISSKGTTDSTVEIELLNDHPIIWKNVAKLSSLIFIFVYAMHFVGSEFGLSRGISTLLISLFEAHAILASVMTEWNLQSQSFDLMKLFFLIILGNTISKSYLAIKGSNLTQKWFFVAVMSGSLIASMGVTYIWSQTFPYH